MGTSEFRAGGAAGVVRWKARYTGRREAWKGPAALGLESAALWEGAGWAKQVRVRVRCVDSGQEHLEKPAGDFEGSHKQGVL